MDVRRGYSVERVQFLEAAVESLQATIASLHRQIADMDETMVEVGDDSPVVSATAFEALVEKIDLQAAEVERLKFEAGKAGEYISRRFTQAKAVVARIRQLADEYDRILDGPPKD